MTPLQFTPTNLNDFEIVTLDFETAYQSAKGKGALSTKYSLKDLTYEEYIFHEHYKEHGVGVKRNQEPGRYFRGEEIEAEIRALENCKRPILLVCHNTLFDGAILAWRYGFVAAFYTCTLALSQALWPNNKNGLEDILIRLFPDDETKRKTHELDDIDGVWELSEEQEQSTETYCLNDIEQTFNAFMQLYQYTPSEEFDVLDLTLRMFIEPGFQLDAPTIERYLAHLNRERAATITAIHEAEDMQTIVREAAYEAEAWARKHSDNPKDFVNEAIRTWKHHAGIKKRVSRKKDTDAIKAIMAWQDEHFDEFPKYFTLVAWRIMFEDQVTDETITDKVLSGADAFALYLNYRYGIRVKRKHSPTPKNKNNTSWALAKDDLEFLDLQRQYPEHRELFKAKLIVSSTQEASRAKRLLTHNEKLGGWLAAPLKYCGALTKRWSGTNGVNFQNFGRNSPIRRALMAPRGYQVGVVDLSNIESRVLAWFAKCAVLNEAYQQGRDIYSEFATIIYDRLIDRKMTALDENGKEHHPHYLEGLVGKVCILGLGYGMGWRTLQTTFAKGAMGAEPLFFDDEFCQRTVNTYRSAYPEIPDAWAMADRVIFDMTNPELEPYSWGPLRVEYRRLRLPNGHYLSYDKLRQSVSSDDRNTQFQYWNGKFWKNLYGGLLIENIIQALSRIIMAWILVVVDRELRKVNGRVLLTVHDEVVFIAPTPVIEQCVEHCIITMRQCPPWCNDGSLALDAEGGFDVNYSK